MSQGQPLGHLGWDALTLSFPDCPFFPLPVPLLPSLPREAPGELPGASASLPCCEGEMGFEPSSI